MGRRIAWGVAAMLWAHAWTADAQVTVPGTQNAALRYWTAFALLQDSPGDDDAAELLAAVAEGRAAWDEERLGPVLDANAEAIGVMRRASTLSDCDWGLEYDRGPAMAVTYLARARVLGRLNTLDGARAMARGDAAGAVDRWLAGIRFSQHVPMGGSLLATLTAGRLLMSSLDALTAAVEGGRLDRAMRDRVERALRAVPETGFDWGGAFRYEQLPIDVWVEQLRRDPDPRRQYERTMGAAPPAGFSLPSQAAVADFRSLMARVIEALRLQPEAASTALAQIEQDTRALHPFYRDIIPNLPRINESRTGVKAARDRLLGALAGA